MIVKRIIITIKNNNNGYISSHDKSNTELCSQKAYGLYVHRKDGGRGRMSIEETIASISIF